MANEVNLRPAKVGTLGGEPATHKSVPRQSRAELPDRPENRHHSPQAFDL
jgi:hypothetical protein